MTPPDNCYHCELPVPTGECYALEVEGQSLPMCCPGCRAVAQLIFESGLGDYYRYRDTPGNNPEAFTFEMSEMLEAVRLYDDPEVQRDFVRRDEAGVDSAILAVEGITCAACAWLIERQLKKCPGVLKVDTNLSQHRVQIQWDATKVALSTLLHEVAKIGYRAFPFQPDTQELLLREESRQALRRLGVAGLGMMQVMMYAVALYAGAFEGIEDVYRDFLRWVSFAVTTPVVLYAAQPFFRACVRDLAAGQLGMDVPVSLAITAAYFNSIWATWFQTGEVYFDSVCMFVFFLSVGRYTEMRARHRSDFATRTLLRLVPEVALRLEKDEETFVPVRSLRVGDRLRIKPGETIPVDGVVVEGVSSVDESMLTGESTPKAVVVGERLIGGTQNIESPLVMEARQVGPETVLSTIVALLDRAQSEKPALVGLADRVARVFVIMVLALAGLTFVAWWMIAPEKAIWVTLSVLVVTCPCALSLATPAALAGATSGLARIGFLATRGHVLESLAKATHVLLDKTGTLTKAELETVESVFVGELEPSSSLALACALESASEHPIAKAFLRATDTASSLEVQELSATPNLGVEGRWEGRRVRIGQPSYVSELWQEEGLQPPEQVLLKRKEALWILMGDENGPLAWFALEDQLRPEAKKFVHELKAQGLQVELLSGDPSPAVQRVARELNIETAQGGLTPRGKLERVRELEAEGAVVVMVGDGVNDAPVLAAAQVSIAMGGGADLAKITADAVLLGDDLSLLTDGLRWARQTRRVIRQNVTWALAYNLCALPLAALGWVPPWLAALGMSASSLLVTVNALRLHRVRAKT